MRFLLAILFAFVCLSPAVAQQAKSCPCPAGECICLPGTCNCEGCRVHYAADDSPQTILAAKVWVITDQYIPAPAYKVARMLAESHNKALVVGVGCKAPQSDKWLASETTIAESYFGPADNGKIVIGVNYNGQLLRKATLPATATQADIQWAISQQGFEVQAAPQQVYYGQPMMGGGSCGPGGCGGGQMMGGFGGGIFGGMRGGSCGPGGCK